MPVGDDGFCDTCRPKLTVENGEATSTEELIAARQHEYGGYHNNAELTEVLIEAWEEAVAKSGNSYNRQQKQAMRMIFHKVARFTFGIPKSHRKHTEDVCGYAKLLHDHTP